MSTPTIKRDAAYVRALEVLEETFGEGTRQAILSRVLHLTKQDVAALASLITLTPESIPAMQEAYRSPTAALTLQAIARTAHCGICHRPLSDPVSVGRGIGPICAGHINGAMAAAPAALPVVRAIIEEPSVAAPIALDLGDLLRTALQQMDALHHALDTASLPQALDDYVEVCLALCHQSRSVLGLLTDHPVLLEQLFGRAAQPSPDPVPPKKGRTPMVSPTALLQAVEQVLAQLRQADLATIAAQVQAEESRVQPMLRSLTLRGKARKEGSTYVWCE